LKKKGGTGHLVYKRKENVLRFNRLLREGGGKGGRIKLYFPKEERREGVWEEGGVKQLIWARERVHYT